MIPLVSEIGADYSQLLNLLESQDWKAADQATTDLMGWIGYELPDDRSGNSSRVATGGWGARKRGPEFPCRDLITIDQLWMYYSDTKFGFSAQIAVYEKSIAKIEDEHRLENSLNDRRTDKFRASSRDSSSPSEDQLAALLSDKFGWPTHSFGVQRSRKDLNFSLNAPIGHLPAGAVRALGAHYLRMDGPRDTSYHPLLMHSGLTHLAIKLRFSQSRLTG